MKYLAIRRQIVISLLHFEGTGIRPMAKAAFSLKSFAMILERDSHVVGLVQKALVLLQAQNKWIKLSGSSWQKVHWSVSLVLIFFKKLLVAIRLCINLKWK